MGGTPKRAQSSAEIPCAGDNHSFNGIHGIAGGAIGVEGGIPAHLWGSFQIHLVELRINGREHKDEGAHRIGASLR